MGRTLWTFIRTDDGNLRRIALAQLQGFYDGKRPLPPAADGFVRVAEIAVEVEGRRLVQVLIAWYPKYTVTAAGIYERHEREKAMRLAMQTVSFGVAEGDNIVHADHRFAQRQYQREHAWEPTEKDLAALRLLLRGPAQGGQPSPPALKLIP